MLPGGSASSQDYPTRPIRMVVAAAVGSGIDLASRVLADKLREELGQPVVVEHRSGADGMIAARYVAAAAPDGYTLLQGSNGHMAINPVLQVNPGYDPQRDFEPISMVAHFPSVLVVTAALPVESVGDLVAYSNGHPDKLNYGSASSNYMLATEMFKKLSGADLHHIPYGGSPGVVNALLAGDVQVAILNIANSREHIKSGKLKALAIMDAAREPTLPAVPTLAEAGVRGYALDVWIGMFAPAGTPPEIIARLNAAILRSLESPEIRDKLAAAGIVLTSSTPQSLRATIVRDTKAYAEMAKALRAASP
jgi:tripartite-type tricarboxylate transporter receptor subunit TctC